MWHSPFRSIGPNPPTIAEIISQSPSVHEHGPLVVAWRLVRHLTSADCGSLIGLAVAVGCLCRALAAITDDDLDAPPADRWLH